MKNYKWMVSLMVLIAFVFQLAEAQNRDERYLSSTDHTVRSLQYLEKGTSLEQVLNTIEREYEVIFLYKSGLLDGKVLSERKRLYMQNNLYDTLNDVLEGFHLAYNKLTHRTLGIFPERNNVVQQHEVSGTVTDTESGETLPGVNILVKGTTIGTSTDQEGQYSLNVPSPQDTLVFSFIGFESREAPINGRTTIDMQLATQTLAGEEVVVIGYGTQRAEEVTGSVSSVKSDDFVKGTVTDVAQLVQGKVAGLNIITPDANPTSTSQINLRGITTLMSSSEPLVLIDGVPGSLDEVSPEEVESIDVLKDGSAAAIYGTRGSNGVILVTTENVVGDIPPTIEINSYINTQAITKRLDFMNASEYRQRVEEGIAGAIDQGASTDWMDEVTRAPVSQVHDLSLRGGNNTTSYILSLRYSDLNGIVKKSNNERIYPRLEVNHSMFDGLLDLRANISGYQQRYYSGSDGGSYDPDVYYNALIYNPTAPVVNENGDWFENINRNVYANPVALLEETRGENQNDNLKIYGTAAINPTNNLSINILGSRDTYRSVRGYYESQNHISTVRDGRNGYASRGTTRSQEDLLEVTAEYDETLLDLHNITVLGGYSWTKYTFEDYWMQNWDFPTDSYGYNNIGAGLALTEGEAPKNSYQEEDKLVSYFFRLNYSFDRRYLLMASLRREGSSKFGVNNKWGNFPAVSVGWNIHNESFMENAALFSSLKLRAGFGVTGTVPTDPYMSLNTIDFDTRAFINGQWVQALSPSSNANPNLRWEKKEEINIGLDYGILNERITGSIDVYQRKTKDMLWDYTVPTPPYLYNTITANAASMENRGLEVQVNAVPVQKTDFQWNTSVSYSTNQNEIVSLSNDNFQLEGGFFDEGSTGEPIQQTTHRVQIGQPIGNFYGYKTVDIDENGHWIIEGEDGEPKPIAQQQAEDKQILGNGLPNHYLNWNNTLTYKNFDFNVQMRGAFGFQILNMPRMFYEAPVMMTRGNVLSSAFDDVYGKRPLATNQALQYVSYYIEDGDYWKISNITLGYSLNLNSEYIRRLRVYASASNVATFTGYSGIDPEVDISGLDPGVDNRFRYPAARTYTLGVSLTF